MDQALSALLSISTTAGLLDETLVVAMGEMGRTPQANDDLGTQSLEHAVSRRARRGGHRWRRIYGESGYGCGVRGQRRLTSPEDLAATIYHALGIDPETRIPNRDGRPVPIVDGGTPVMELFS